MERPGSTDGRGGRDGPLVNRRELLTALGGAAGATALTPGTTAATATAGGTPTLTVRIYPGPVPLHGWAQSGVVGMHNDWPIPYRDGLAAVEDALDRVLEYARTRSRLPSLEITVERAEPVRFPLSETPTSSEAVVPSLSTVLEAFRERLADRDVLDAMTCHALFCWSPLNHRVGYGGTLSPNAHVGSTADAEDAASVDGALTVANLGATEIWDSRAVTRNMAIHEVLHTFLTPGVAEAVGGTACDHDLGAAVRTDADADDRRHELRVTPMATAYAGPPELGGSGTRFPGRGCRDHDEFHRHDGFEDVEKWTYTTEPSDATLEAATRYLERIVEQ